jgi:diguanylate cyclase (GGDEF)-like protein
MSRLLHLTLLLVLCISACSPAPETSPAEPQAHAVPGLLQLERQGAAQPKSAAQELLVLYQQQAPGSYAALDALSLRGSMLSLDHDSAGVDAVVAQLEHWPEARFGELAKAVALYVRARQAMADGRHLDAHQQIERIERRVLREAPLDMRLRFLRTQGRANYRVGRIDEAIALYLAALPLAEQTGRVWLQALCRADLATAYLQAQQADQALAMVDAATRLAEQDPDPLTLNSVFTARMIVYAESSQEQEARRSAEEAIGFARAAGARAELALGLANLTDMHLRSGDFAKAYKLSEEALPLAREARNPQGEVVALVNMGLAKIALGELAQGKALVQQGVEIGQRQGSSNIVGTILTELGGYLEKAGDLAGAVDAFHQSRTVSDEWLKQKDRKAILEAQERYDSERRARQMELLDRDRAVAAEALRHDQLQMRLWAVLTACFVVLGVLLFTLYQRVRKTNAALASSNELLKVQGEIDPLTGLANRRHFQQAIKRLTPAGVLRGTVFMIDIDNFKLVNDRFGHAAGDAVLVEVAHRLRQTMRAEDLVVRWGGEEFVVVIESAHAETVQALAQRLLDLIAAIDVKHAGQTIPVTASIGFASFPLMPHGLELGWERAINLVDTAMYLAKAHGRNRAYGVNHVDVQSEQALDDLVQGMDAAWRDGRVGAIALQGPQAVQDEVAA